MGGSLIETFIVQGIQSKFWDWLYEYGRARNAYHIPDHGTGYGGSFTWRHYIPQAYAANETIGCIQFEAQEQESGVLAVTATLFTRYDDQGGMVFDGSTAATAYFNELVTAISLEYQADDHTPPWANEDWYKELSPDDRRRYDLLRPHKEAWEAGFLTNRKLAKHLGVSLDTARGWRRALKMRHTPGMDWKRQ